MTATIHDSGYKRLFGNKTIFRQLFETFVEEEWVQRLDFERAERLDKSFVSEHYKDTEADIIYKVPILNSDKAIYLCLLIEFQSNVQRFMILRSLQYKCNFYMDFVLSNKNVRGLMLPAMFPLVLYNGEDKWTAPANMDQLIENEVDLGQYGLHFEHLVIAENSYGKEWLAKIDNIIATLFLAEAHYDLPLLLEKLLTLYETEPDRQALMLFINWFRQLAAHGRLKSADFAQIEEQDLTREEVKSMLIKALERERELIFDSGKQEGIQERNRQIAQAMVGNGFPLPTIATLLNLSLSEVEQLLARAVPTAQVDDSDTTD
jgi:predicted transposase/invertase (TIGR01784 family)